MEQGHQQRLSLSVPVIIQLPHDLVHFEQCANIQPERLQVFYSGFLRPQKSEVPEVVASADVSFTAPAVAVCREWTSSVDHPLTP